MLTLAEPALTRDQLVLTRSGLVLSLCTRYVVSLIHEYLIPKLHYELINQLAGLLLLRKIMLRKVLRIQA